MILIITLAQDLHALEVFSAIKKLGYKNVHIVETDKISTQCPLSIRIGKSKNQLISSKITTNNGEIVNIEDCKTIWVRRPFAEQIDDKDRSPSELEYISNECKSGIGSIISASNFKGNWVSHPDATIKSSDKILQLKTALEVGFKIPKTLVSQSKKDILEFYKECNRKIIVKPLLGVSDKFLETKQLKNPNSVSKEAYTICPAIYQELIPGHKHIRLNSFGSYKKAALIEADNLDWRSNLNIPISEWTIPASLAKSIDNILERLGLAMGVFDFKLNDKDELVWFEVNPQGQFLFLEPFLKVNLAENFARFLIERTKDIN